MTHPLNHVPLAPPDPILGVAEAYRQDSRAHRVNLGAGVYQDERGLTPVFEAVRSAEQRLMVSPSCKTYLPIGGSPQFTAHLEALLFGQPGPLRQEGRLATVQTAGGTGALRAGAELLRRFLPEGRVWVSRPTWPNHSGIFTSAGFAIEEYPYFDRTRGSLDWDDVRQTLERIPSGDVVVLHASCHNPTGMDLTADQWDDVARMCLRQGWIPFLDFAYHGLGAPLEEEATQMAKLAQTVPVLLVAYSCSKNFGLYCERVGALSLVGAHRRHTEALVSQVKVCIRTLWSNPPAHGARIVETILADANLREPWRAELGMMRRRLEAMRDALAQGLQKRGWKVPPCIEGGRGMFALLNLSESQRQWLQEHRAIYTVVGGRINVAGLTPANVEYVCDALAEVQTRA